MNSKQSVKENTNIVDDARFVSSCLSWPSNANPRLSFKKLHNQKKSTTNLLSYL